MIGLLVTTIFTSAADSLNPVAITQQFILQGIVKKPKHIWFFILATGITNFIGGLMAYYGLVVVISNLFISIFKKLVPEIYIVELIIGISIIVFILYKFINKNIIRQAKNSDLIESDKRKISKKIKSVSPLSLFILGVIATITELTTAVPYFAFLTVLLNYELSFLSVILILVIYNVIYSLPLVILYFVYIMKYSLFEKFYLLIEKKATKLSSFIMPIICGGIGIFFIYHSISSLIN
ncbi:MAG: GAP family protein [Clostridium sp.]|nr:GAP family protein [Clostridium sp.]